MKHTKKIIALVLAMVLAFSSVSVIASASAINDKTDTVEKLIQGDSVGSLVEWLLKNLNNRKEEVVGSVLRLVFMFVEDETLKAKIGSTDLMKASDEQLADILIGWLDANLPTWTSGLTDQDWWGIVTSLTPILGIKLDLSNARAVVMSLADICGVANNNFLLNLGDLEKLSDKTIKNINKKSKSIDVVYALFSWLADDGTVHVLKQALNGKLSLGKTVENVAKGTSEDINNMIKDAIGPDAIKGYLMDALSLDKETYKSYTADELVAVAFLQLLTGADKIAQNEAADVMNLSIYGLLENYAGDIYANLLLDLLNNDAKNALKDLAAKDTTGKLAQVLNLEYEFKADTFDAYLGAGKGNMVAQLNNVVITLLEVIVKPAELAKLGLTKGGNENLNDNLTKTFRYLLPLIKDLPDLGVDLSGFTTDKVKNMSAEEMAVAVLKLFFSGWFKNADMNEVDSAKTLEQLGVLAAKYAVTNKEWVPMDITAVAKAKDVAKLSDEKCLDIVFEIGMETAAKALNYNKGTTYYELPADTSKWTGEDYLDDIVDWALNFVDGLPASADKLSTKRHVIDGNGGFYKLDVILDSLFDLSFISGCGNGSFALDVETMLMDKFLGNLLDFDLKASVDILAQNEKASLFDRKVNKAVIDLVDDLLTGLFEEGYKLPDPPAEKPEEPTTKPEEPTTKPEEPTTKPEEPAAKRGDVDGNGNVTAADARLALRRSVGLEPKLTDVQLKAADVDGKAGVTAADARLILRASVGLEKF